jgi:hypothetical protein
MANLLKMAQIQAIEVLRARNWSLRRIARELGLDRGTVAKYVRQAQRAASQQNQPNLPAGSDDQNRPNPPPSLTVKAFPHCLQVTLYSLPTVQDPPDSQLGRPAGGPTTGRPCRRLSYRSRPV